MAETDSDAGNDGIEAGPRAALMEEVAAQMDAIETDFGDDYKIGSVVTIVEVIGAEGTEIRVRCNQQPWIGIGMLRFAEKALEGEPG